MSYGQYREQQVVLYMAKPYLINRKEVFSLNGYSVKSIIKNLNNENYCTAYGYKIINKDIYNAVAVMKNKHYRCEWINKVGTEVRISLEGYYWFTNVYFNKKGTELIDADIKYFEQLIGIYEKNCKKNNIDYELIKFIPNDMNYKELTVLTHRSYYTVRDSFMMMPDNIKKQSYYYNGKKYITADACEKLCKTKFKQCYLHYLENMYLMLKKKINMIGVEIVYE